MFMRKTCIYVKVWKNRCFISLLEARYQRYLSLTKTGFQRRWCWVGGGEKAGGGGQIPNFPRQILSGAWTFMDGLCANKYFWSFKNSPVWTSPPPPQPTDCRDGFLPRPPWTRHLADQSNYEGIRWTWNLSPLTLWSLLNTLASFCS